MREERGHDGEAAVEDRQCAAGTYEVLERFDTATTGEDDAQAKCKDVQGYTKWYFYDSALDRLDFVLCLKLR